MCSLRCFGSLVLLAAVMLMFSCEKEDKKPNINPSVEGLSIDSFQVSTHMVRSWYDTAHIQVFITGKDYTIHWECDHGVISGSGDRIKYHAGECCVGWNTISCTVKDSTREVMDTVMVQVKSILEQ